MKLGKSKDITLCAFENIGRLPELSELSLRCVTFVIIWHSLGDVIFLASGNEFSDGHSIEVLGSSISKMSHLHEFLIQNNQLTDQGSPVLLLR